MTIGRQGPSMMSALSTATNGPGDHPRGRVGTIWRSSIRRRCQRSTIFSHVTLDDCCKPGIGARTSRMFAGLRSKSLNILLRCKHVKLNQLTAVDACDVPDGCAIRTYTARGPDGFLHPSLFTHARAVTKRVMRDASPHFEPPSIKSPNHFTL